MLPPRLLKESYRNNGANRSLTVAAPIRAATVRERSYFGIEIVMLR